MTLVPLYDLTQQFNNKNGAILVGGRLYVYYVGRTELATTWADEDASAVNSNPVLLDNNGRAPVFVDDSYSYTLVVCDRAGTELFSQDITPGGAGSVGGRIVYHDETLSGAGTVSSLLGVVNIPLGVDETMTAYTGVAEGKDALILGVNGDWFNETFSGEFDQKVDWETFSACCSAVKGGLDNKLDASAINNYYTKNEVDGRTSSFVNYNFLSGNYYNKFETSSREELYSAFLSAGQGGGGSGDCPWISGAKVIGDTITLTDNLVFQVLSSFDLSGYRNHCIGVKGGVYRFPNRWEIASGIAETNYFMPQSGMSGYLPISSFSSYTASIQNNLNSNWDYTNSAYSLSLNNFYNKLDASAFSAWSASYSGNSEVNNYVTNNSSFIDESVNVVQTNSAQWSEGSDDTEVNNYVYNNSAINNEVNSVVSSNSGNWNNITGLNEIKNYNRINLLKSTPTGNVLQGYVTPIDSADNLGILLYDNLSGIARYGGIELTVTGVPTLDDMSAYQPVSGMTAYQPVSSMTGYQPVGNYAEKSDFTFVQAPFIYDDVYFGGFASGISGKNIYSNLSFYALNDTNGNKFQTSYLKISAASAWSGDLANKIEDKVDTSAIESSGALWNAVYDLVATYSAKWLINGDV